jgi:hypothetical protein
MNNYTNTLHRRPDIPAFRQVNCRSDLINSALDLASSNLPVFACTSKKTPCGGHGHLDATTDRAAILDMFSHPYARMIGVPTGAVSGFMVLDSDPRHGGDVWLQDNRRRIPRTRVHRTMSNGRHLLLRHHPGVRNSQSVIAAGIDIRADGGYVIHPPSPGYGIVDGADIAECPEWLLPLILPEPKPERPEPETITFVPVGKPRLEGVRKAILDRVGRANDGERHAARLRAGRALGGIAAELGFTDKTAVSWVMAALPTVSGSKAHDEAARKTIQAGLTDGRKTPLVLEDRPYARVAR